MAQRWFHVMCASAALSLATASVALAEKVGVCHQTGSASNQVVFISVSESAVPAHSKHGDVIAPDFANDPANCGACGVSCDDGDLCTTDSCSEGACVNTPITCDDANVCTDDSCDPATGGCVNTAVADRECDDADACTEGDVCDANGACGGTGVSCDDGNECTDDTCDSAAGCANTPIADAPCDGGAGVCDVNGVCQPTT